MQIAGSEAKVLDVQRPAVGVFVRQHRVEDSVVAARARSGQARDRFERQILMIVDVHRVPLHSFEKRAERLLRRRMIAEHDGVHEHANRAGHARIAASGHGACHQDVVLTGEPMQQDVVGG